MLDVKAYEALRQAAALVERPSGARVRVSGKHRLEFLHRMTSQELRTQKPGEGRTAVLLTDKGRVVDHLSVYALEEELRILSAREDATASLAHLKKYALRDDFKPEDQTASTALLRVLGPRSAEALEAAGAPGAGDLAALGIRPLPDGEGYLLATDGPCARNLALWVPAARAQEWKERLLERAHGIGLRLADAETYEVVRIESGHPAHGPELSEEVNPLEAGLRDSIHWNKGCYIGQEVIARLDTYQKVQRHLVGLRLPGAARPPAPGSRLLVGGERVGWVTSATHSPALSEPVALAYLKTQHAAEGTEVKIEAGGTITTARVAALPMVS
ncbi:MAG: glycine cleavage T C-terminal barrel domain-containing protein [Acidobacteriota bacterium]